jgi:hypothetical protein
LIGKDEDTCPPSPRSFGAPAPYAQALRRAKDLAFHYGMPRRSLAANVFGILKRGARDLVEKILGKGDQRKGFLQTHYSQASIPSRFVGG